MLFVEELSLLKNGKQEHSQNLPLTAAAALLEYSQMSFPMEMANFTSQLFHSMVAVYDCVLTDDRETMNGKRPRRRRNNPKYRAEKRPSYTNYIQG